MNTQGYGVRVIRSVVPIVSRFFDYGTFLLSYEFTMKAIDLQSIFCSNLLVVLTVVICDLSYSLSADHFEFGEACGLPGESLRKKRPFRKHHCSWTWQ